MSAALLDAILLAPDDVAPRLVYADWLLERGDVRGELIRLQCDCARDGISEDEYTTLFQRGEALLVDHEDRWTKPIRGCVTGWWFDRGFPDHVQLTAAKLIAKGARLAAATPLRHVTITKWPTKAMAASVAKTPELARVFELCVRGDATAGAAATLLASPHLARLSGLELDSAVAARQLASLPGLRSLSVGTTVHGRTAAPPFGRAKITVDGSWIAGLARAVPALRRLSLSDQDVGADGVAALVASPLAKQLDALMLYDCRIPAGADRTLKKQLRAKCELSITEAT